MVVSKRLLIDDQLPGPSDISELSGSKTSLDQKSFVNQPDELISPTYRMNKNLIPRQGYSFDHNDVINKGKRALW